MPIDYGQSDNQKMIFMLIHYVYFGYTLWGPIMGQWSVLIYSNVIVKKILYNDELSYYRLMQKNLIPMFMSFISCLVVHAALSWVGYNYLNSEL